MNFSVTLLVCMDDWYKVCRNCNFWKIKIFELKCYFRVIPLLKQSALLKFQDKIFKQFDTVGF